VRPLTRLHVGQLPIPTEKEEKKMATALAVLFTTVVAPVVQLGALVLALLPPPAPCANGPSPECSAYQPPPLK
jgi:hypothetical protein